jgi:hypothetical protein
MQMIEALIQATNDLILKYIQTTINGIYGGNTSDSIVQ